MSQQQSLHYAVVGGGVLGLASACQLLKAKPDIQITLYEQGGEQTYREGSDTSHRASLGISNARTLRMMGAQGEVGRQNVMDTVAMIRDLEEQYGETILHPLESVYLAKGKKDQNYAWGCPR